MAKNRIITVQDIPITVSEADMDDYICITDMAAAKSDNSRAADVVRNWLRNRTTLEFLSTWEEMYNPDFKVFDSEHFKKQAGLLTFTPSISEWVEQTNAIGLYVKKCRYGGTFAHKDIAFEFASAISPVFKLYLIKEFQRLKEREYDIKKIEWDAKRFLSKNNYLIQTNAVKNYLIPSCNYREELQWLPYAEEADLLNVALFGFTAKAWREANPDLAKTSNMRDYSTINELTVLSNLETHNAQMIREGRTKEESKIVLERIIGGENPIHMYKFVDADVLILLGTVGCPACAGKLDLFNAMGVNKVMFCGGGGVLDKNIEVGQILVVDGAIRDEGFSYHYIEPSRYIYTDKKVTDKIVKYLDEKDISYLRGITWTTDAMFRETEDRIERRKEEGAKIVENSLIQIVPRTPPKECTKLI